MGRSSYLIGRNIKGRLLDIDSFVGDAGSTESQEELEACYRSNLGAFLGSTVELMSGDSHEILKTLDRKFDIIFIDGSH